VDAGPEPVIRAQVEEVAVVLGLSARVLYGLALGLAVLGVTVYTLGASLRVLGDADWTPESPL
jgi:hypothetical protein